MRRSGKKINTAWPKHAEAQQRAMQCRRLLLGNKEIVVSLTGFDNWQLPLSVIE